VTRATTLGVALASGFAFAALLAAWILGSLP